MTSSILLEFFRGRVGSGVRAGIAGLRFPFSQDYSNWGLVMLVENSKKEMSIEERAERALG